MKIFINPGHALGGDPDPGACNEELGLRECDIMLTLGCFIGSVLQDVGHEVRLLQSDNLMGESPAFQNVTAEANAWDADIFLSLHCNASQEHQARGCETLCFKNAGNAGRLAASIQQCLHQALSRVDADFPDRGVKERPELCVLNRTTMPAVLVECAFIDEPHDAQLLMRHLPEIGASIVSGLLYCRWQAA